MYLTLAGMAGLYYYYSSSTIEVESQQPSERLLTLKNGFTPTTVIDPSHEDHLVDLRLVDSMEPDVVVKMYQQYQLHKTQYELQSPEFESLKIYL